MTTATAKPIQVTVQELSQQLGTRTLQLKENLSTAERNIQKQLAPIEDYVELKASSSSEPISRDQIKHINGGQITNDRNNMDYHIVSRREDIREIWKAKNPGAESEDCDTAIHKVNIARGQLAHTLQERRILIRSIKEIEFFQRQLAEIEPDKMITLPRPLSELSLDQLRVFNAPQELLSDKLMHESTRMDETTFAERLSRDTGLRTEITRKSILNQRFTEFVPVEINFHLVDDKYQFLTSLDHRLQGHQPNASPVNHSPEILLEGRLQWQPEEKKLVCQNIVGQGNEKLDATMLRNLIELTREMGGEELVVPLAGNEFYARAGAAPVDYPKSDVPRRDDNFFDAVRSHLRTALSTDSYIKDDATRREIAEHYYKRLIAHDPAVLSELAHDTTPVNAVTSSRLKTLGQIAFNDLGSSPERFANAQMRFNVKNTRQMGMVAAFLDDHHLSLTGNTQSVADASKLERLWQQAETEPAPTNIPTLAEMRSVAPTIALQEEPNEDMGDHMRKAMRHHAIDTGRHQ